MAITELVFVPLKANEQVRADFYNEIPSLIRATFNVVGGPMASVVGRVLESKPTSADNHCGYLVIFCWESIDMIKDFMKTPGFVNFKASLAGYVDGPPTLQFFEAPPGIAPEETLHDSTHFFFMKSTGTGVQVSHAKQKWDELAATFSRVADDNVKYHNGDGVQEYNGHFAGFSGWKSISALDKALGQMEIQKQLETLTKVGGSISTFTLELNRVF
ncbi:uncharacterized protein LY79DRAFT_204333 [Colletotrichum navitas]|uniref:ABM domain-containing protein n=1 Tax=Colletotrichum navitas TaxID=681940 RepID=A0AAD8QB33_9PEZI|nr:uncharacterized protein LY79DRAFT_204333 [Colletotrichum navitas]KAK1598959.1 hypothetical protein LY79DRAFT_204333 [Colletotrichum navitas]